jgi:hypothetical protein
MHFNSIEATLLDCEISSLDIVCNCALDVPHTELNGGKFLYFLGSVVPGGGYLQTSSPTYGLALALTVSRPVSDGSRNAPSMPYLGVDIPALSMHGIDCGFPARNLLCVEETRNTGHCIELDERWETFGDEEPAESGMLGVVQNLKAVGDPCAVRVSWSCIGIEWNTAISG